jgi:mevalonate kinase
MPARRPVAVSAPGKLILMGEHAAVYGRPALIAAIDLRLTARFSPLPSGETRIPEVQLDLPGLGHVESTSWEDLRAYARATRDRWDRYAERPAPAAFQEVRGEDRAHVVKTALGEVAEALTQGKPGSEGLRLRVESELPIGSGFGSSAATATAVVAGLLAYFGKEDGLEQIAHLALEVERRQHGLPSGVDGVTVLHGGVLWARRLESGHLEVEPLAVRSPLLDSLRVYDTGTPSEPTGAVVAAVRALRERDPSYHEELLDRMEAATRAFRDLLQGDPAGDPDRALHLIREHEACLEGLGVVPEQVRNLVRQVEDEGGAAKISGAGALSGPGAGSLLVYHPDRERVARWTFLRPFPFHPVHLGAPGFRREAFG